jgi:hypothetical protein
MVVLLLVALGGLAWAQGVHSCLAGCCKAPVGVPHSQVLGVALQEAPEGAHMVLPSAVVLAALPAALVQLLAQAHRQARAALLLLVLVRQLLLEARMQQLLLARKLQEQLLRVLLQQQLLLWLIGASQAACGLLHLHLAWWRALPAWPVPLAAPACHAGTAHHAQPP